MHKSLKETLKFIARYVVLVGLPLAIHFAAGLTGLWGQLTSVEIPVLLPVIDKFLHENDNINVNGIVPF